MYVCVFVSVCERETLESGCVCVCERETLESVCVCVR